MKRRRLKLKVRIPPYITPRNEWRRLIHDETNNSALKNKVAYTEDDKLEIDVRLYLHTNAIEVHDVDNRLKDIMDALQGRVGGPKSIHELKPIIYNDNQVYKVTIEKLKPPKQSLGMGHLIIKRYVPAFKVHD